MALLPEGYYRAVAENPGLGESSKQGTPAFKLSIKIVEDGPYKGIRLPWEGWLTASAAERSIEQMEIAGATFPDDPETGEPNLRDFTGIGTTEFSIGVEVEEYTPEPTPPTAENPNPPAPRTTKRNRTTFINRGNESRLKDIDPEKQLMIARQFAGTVMLVRKKREERMAGKAAGGNGSDFDTAGMEAAAAAERAAEAAKAAAIKGSAAKGGAAKPGAAKATGKGAY